MTVECYAQRLLNPYRGTMHTIRYEAAEAVTLDGVHWDIYVANDSLLEGLAARHPQITDIRFGAWSAKNGLKRGPIYSSEDFRRMEEMGAMLYQHLTRVHRRVPFPLRDRFELWLLDEEDRPLALLASAITPDEMEWEGPLAWRAGFVARDHFRSDALDTGLLAASDYLAERINARAGPRPAAQWFWRDADGAGQGLAVLGEERSLGNRRLPAEAFPPLLLALDGLEGGTRRLAEDFQAWQAPWLLALPGLAADLRRHLETQARAQATVVARLYRLYPEVCDRRMLHAALVEAVMRGAETPARPGEIPLSTFYIELDTPEAPPPEWERGR